MRKIENPRTDSRPRQHPCVFRSARIGKPIHARQHPCRPRLSHPPMSCVAVASPCASIRGVNRSAIIVLVAVGVTLAGFALASDTGILEGSTTSTEQSTAAGPQQATLGWREVYGKPGEQIVFTVDSLEVTKNGWSARIGIENQTQLGWELVPGGIPGGSFGLALFQTGDTKELDERNRTGTLPAVREATTYDPELAKIIEPKASWKGEMSAHGSLVAGAWARVVFGTLVAVGKPPPSLNDTLVWITDSAYRLRA